MHLFWDSRICIHRGVTLTDDIVNDERIAERMYLDWQTRRVLQKAITPITFKKLLHECEGQLNLPLLKEKVQYLYANDLICIKNSGAKKIFYPNNIIIWFENYNYSLLFMLNIFIAVAIVIVLILKISFTHIGLEYFLRYCLFSSVFVLSFGIHEAGHFLAYNIPSSSSSGYFRLNYSISFCSGTSSPRKERVVAVFGPLCSVLFVLAVSLITDWWMLSSIAILHLMSLLPIFSDGQILWSRTK